MLVARSTPIYPIQEIWSYANKQQIKKNKLRVMNQAGTFDFRVGEQKRAPKLIRTLRLEWLWRLIATPKRQIKKTLDSLGILPYIFSYLLLKKRSR
jgi:exopolysaccharide biosynthesis WecB/TagA/CpsF family protein